MPYLDAEGRERDVVYHWQRRMVIASLSEPEGRLRFFISIILDRPIVVLRGEKTPSCAVLHSATVVAISAVGRLLTNVTMEQLLAVGFKCDSKQDTRIMLTEMSLVVYTA